MLLAKKNSSAIDRGIGTTTTFDFFKKIEDGGLLVRVGSRSPPPAAAARSPAPPRARPRARGTRRRRARSGTCRTPSRPRHLASRGVQGVQPGPRVASGAGGVTFSAPGRGCAKSSSAAGTPAGARNTKASCPLWYVPHSVPTTAPRESRGPGSPAGAPRGFCSPRPNSKAWQKVIQKP